MNTEKWGPSAWFFLHCVTFNYPEYPTYSQIIYNKQLFTNFAETLPCKYCRESYKKFLKEEPIDNYLGSREDLTYWLYKIHNMVNDKLRDQGKNIPPNPTFKEVCKFYEQFRATCGAKKMSCNGPPPKNKLM